jgi:hypothetical protein
VNTAPESVKFTFGLMKEMACVTQATFKLPNYGQQPPKNRTTKAGEAEL